MTNFLIGVVLIALIVFGGVYIIRRQTKQISEEINEILKEEAEETPKATKKSSRKK